MSPDQLEDDELILGRPDINLPRGVPTGRAQQAAGSKKRRRSPVDVDDDRDHLAMDTPPKKSAKTEGPRAANSNGRQPSKSVASRGDIHSTDFALKSKLKYGPDRSPKFRVLRAVCGKSTYVEGSNPQIPECFLAAVKGNPNVLETVIGHDSPLSIPWLEVNLATGKKLRHGVTNSPYIFWERSSGNGKGPKLALEFENNVTASGFFDWMKKREETGAGTIKIITEDFSPKTDS